jgi:hypothetical protein
MIVVGHSLFLLVEFKFVSSNLIEFTMKVTWETCLMFTFVLFVLFLTWKYVLFLKLICCCETDLLLCSYSLKVMQFSTKVGWDVNKVCYQFPVHALGSSDWRMLDFCFSSWLRHEQPWNWSHWSFYFFHKTNPVIKAVLSLVGSEQGCPNFIFVPMEVGTEKKWGVMIQFMYTTLLTKRMNCRRTSEGSNGPCTDVMLIQEIICCLSWKRTVVMFLKNGLCGCLVGFQSDLKIWK